MLALLFCWTFIFFVSISIGRLSTIIYNRIIGRKAKYDLFSLFFIGISLTGAISSFLSIFFPLNKIILLFFVVTSLLSWLIDWKELKKISKEFISSFSLLNRLTIPFILITVTVILFSVTKPLSYDTPLYHIQSILWNENFSVVPGLANLHDRLGFNSNLLVLSSVFTFNFLFDQPIFGINSACILFFTLWLATVIIKKPSIYGLLCLIVYYLFFSFYADSISSPSTDLLPNLLCLYLLLRVLMEEQSVREQGFIYIVIPLFCVTLKLSVFPIAILALLAVLRLRSTLTFGKGIFIGFAACIVVMPWLIRNVILTGYLFYPLPAVDYFNFDWKVPAAHVANLQNWVYSWARIPGLNESEVLKLNIFEWFPKWWPGPSSSGILFILSVISPITLLWIKMNRIEAIVHARMTNETKFNSSINHTDLVFVWIISFLGFASWFLTAPAFRFSYSFLLILSILPALLFEKSIYPIEKYLKIFCFAALILFNVLFIGKGFNSLDEPINKSTLMSWLFKPGYKRAVGMEFLEYKVRGLIIFAPKTGELCFDKFPCMPGYYSALKTRSRSIQDGFKYEESIILEDTTGEYRLFNGIVYKDEISLYDSNYKNEPAVNLYLNSAGYAEFTTSTGSIWNSQHAWIK